MKKLAILASVVMIVTAPIMAQTRATDSPEEIRTSGRAANYGIEAPSTELVEGATATVEFSAETAKPSEEVSGRSAWESKQSNLNSGGAVPNSAGDKTSIDVDPLNKSPSSLPIIK
jgi:hypothetical protein